MPVARACVSTHANNCKKHLARETFFSRRTRTSKDIRFQAFARLFSGSWEKRFPARKVFFSRPLFQAQRKWLKRSCSHACGREEGPKEPRIGPRTGCETCQVGAFRRHRVARPRAQPQPRPNPSPGQPAQRE